MKAIIFVGGSGKRLWPLSRKSSPKQFLTITQDKSLLQLCVDRLVPGFDMEDIYISTNTDFVNEVKKQLPSLPAKNIIAEPMSRDVGPAVGLSIAIFAKLFPDEPIVILWGDHLVKREGRFRLILKVSEDLIKKGEKKIVLIGQTPRFASENLGWIRYGETLLENKNVIFHNLEGFEYRPDKATAEKYFEDGHHAWNLGYFVTTPSYLWQEFERSAPKLAAGLSKIQDSYGTSEYQKVLTSVYPKLEEVSFDNAVVEKMDFKEGAVVSSDLGWSDVGAWEALKEALERNHEDNVTQGKVILEDSTDSLVYNYEEGKFVVGIDLNDFLVVNTPDVLLVTKKSSVPKVKKLVSSLEEGELKDLT